MDTGPKFDELNLKQRLAFALFFFAVRLWTRVAPNARDPFGLRKGLEGGVVVNVPHETFLIDNGYRSVKLSIYYMPIWEGPWDAEGQG